MTTASFTEAWAQPTAEGMVVDSDNSHGNAHESRKTEPGYPSWLGSSSMFNALPLIDGKRLASLYDRSPILVEPELITLRDVSMVQSKAS